MKSLLAVWALVLALANAAAASTAPPGQTPGPEICDSAADFALAIEDYHAAVRLHLAHLKQIPDDALAHYHLGFAYSMLGQSRDEIREYRRAVALGLRLFDLYINLGMACLQTGNLTGAKWSFHTALRLTNGPEPHFGLALAYERGGNYPDAISEIRAALTRAPHEPAYLNMLAVLTAETGEPPDAR